MQFEKIHNKGQARLFESRYMEMLTKSHPLVIWGMYIPIIAYMLYRAYNVYTFSAVEITVIFFAAVLSWTLFEYVAHRFVFHHIADSERGKKFIYVLHGNHHEYPRDRSRLFMPPLPSLIITTIIFSLMYLFLGNYTFIFWPGFMFGYLMYGSVHYAIHAWAPPFRWMKPLWRNHHLHHYKTDHKGFGVSTTIWDRVFGTMFDVSKEDRPQAVKTSRELPVQTGQNRT